MRTHSTRAHQVTSAHQSSVNLAPRPFPVQAKNKQSQMPQPDESSEEVQSLRPGRNLSNMDVFPRQSPSAKGSTALPGALRAKMEMAFQSDFS
jgi:hypothetical protein